jgi:hypothetical protein
MVDSANHAIAIIRYGAPLDAVTDFLSFVNSGAQMLTITTVSGEVVALGALPSGQYRIRASQVWATGTTVTSIVGWWS